MKEKTVEFYIVGYGHKAGEVIKTGRNGFCLEETGIKAMIAMKLKSFYSFSNDNLKRLYVSRVKGDLEQLLKLSVTSSEAKVLECWPASKFITLKEAKEIAKIASLQQSIKTTESDASRVRASLEILEKKVASYKKELAKLLPNLK